ncbi:DUF599 domain-containing protein [Thalassotalea aquiviva]|uniref:DUF599 domain-containing protein n=1 Tax=Thalassotalea aquiviva TaxID=3242415 RepID=UPI00352A4BAA
MPLHLIDFVAIIIFVTCWVGYTFFSKAKAKNTACISRCTQQHRILWMRQIFDTEVRVAHAALLANLERNVAFFASTTLFVLAGALALFSQVEQIRGVLASITFTREPSVVAIQIKLCFLIGIFVMAFFQFTWSMRQYGFVNIMIGAAPYEPRTQKPHLLSYAKQMAVAQDQAAHAYNYGLRSYYFSLSLLSWFIDPLIFMSSSVFVVLVLYRREFKSKALKALQKGIRELEKETSTTSRNEPFKVQKKKVVE